MRRWSDADRLDFQLRRDAALRVVLLAWVAVAVVLEGVLGGWSLVALGVGLGGWVFAAVRSAAVAQGMGELNRLIEASPEQADPQIRRALSQPLLPRALRLQLSHRLALLRRRQGRTDDVASICGAALRHTRPGGSSLRVHLLLMLTEALLARGQLGPAYACLMEVHGARRNLLETLQLLALQTRYELAAGYPHAAWHNGMAKAALAELMPQGPCATLHAMLAQAAARVGDTAAAHWLSERAALLADPAAVNALLVDQIA